MRWSNDNKERVDEPIREIEESVGGGGGGEGGDFKDFFNTREFVVEDRRFIFVVNNNVPFQIERKIFLQ